jgi:hypothetical protein
LEQPSIKLPWDCPRHYVQQPGVERACGLNQIFQSVGEGEASTSFQRTSFLLNYKLTSAIEYQRQVVGQQLTTTLKITF